MNSQSESGSRPNFLNRPISARHFPLNSFSSRFTHLTLTWCSVRKTTFFCEKLVSESNTKNMPIFCNYGEVEVAAQETGQFKLSKIKLDGESPRKWYRSSVSTFLLASPFSGQKIGQFRIFWRAFLWEKFSDFEHERNTWQFGVAGSAKFELG